VANVRLERVLFLVTGKTDQERRSDSARESSRNYYLRNKEKILARDKERRAANPEQMLELNKKRREDYRARQSAQKKEYYLRNKEKILAANKKWRDANKEKAYEGTKEWRKANPDKLAKHRTEYYARNKEEISKRYAKRRAELSDGIVKNIFCQSQRGAGLRQKEVPAEMIPLIRASLLITRELRALSKKP